LSKANNNKNKKIKLPDPTNPVEDLRKVNELIEYEIPDYSHLEKPDENSYNELGYFFKHQSVDTNKSFIDLANELDIDPNTAIKYIRELGELIFTEKEDFNAVCNSMNDNITDEQYYLSPEELEKVRIIPQRVLKFEYDFSNPEEPKILSITIKSPYNQYVAFEEDVAKDEEELQNVPSLTSQSYNTAQPNKLSNNMTTPIITPNPNQVPNQPPVQQPVYPSPTAPPIQTRNDLLLESEQAEESELQEPFMDRYDLMKWILKELPGVQPAKKKSYFAYFKRDNRQFMLNPDHMQRFTISFFGPTTGQIVYDRFRSMLPQQLPTEEQFGYDSFSTAVPGQPNQQQQQNHGYGYGTQQQGQKGQQQQQQNDPYINSIGYYQAVGAIPPYVNPYAPEARRMAWEYEEKARKKKERQEQREEMEDDFRMYMQQQMTSIFDQRKNGGGQMGPDGQPMMNGGMMGGGMNGGGGMINTIPVSTTLPDGRTETVWMPQHLYYQRMMMQGNNQNNNGNDPNAMLATMNNIYSTILQNNNAPIQFMKSLLDTFVAKLPGQIDPMAQISNTMKVVQELGGGMGNQMGGTIDAARVMLDSKRLDKDFELSHMTLQHRQKLEYEREKAQIEADASNKQNAGSMVQNFTTIGKDLVIPLLGMFMAMKGGGAGGANPMAMMQGLSSMFGGMGGGDQAGGQPDNMMGGGMQQGANPFANFNVPPMQMPSTAGGMGYAADQHEAYTGGGPGQMHNPFEQIGAAQMQRQYDIDNRPPSKWNAPPSDMYGSYDTTHVPDPNAGYQQQQQPMQSGVQVKRFQDDGKYEQPIDYTPDQFMGLSLEELEDRLRRTRNSALSVNNYENALVQTIAMKGGQQQQQYEQTGMPIQQQQQQQLEQVPEMTQTSDRPITNEAFNEEDNEELPGADQFDDYGSNNESTSAVIKDVQPVNAVSIEKTEQSIIE